MGMACSVREGTGREKRWGGIDSRQIHGGGMEPRRRIDAIALHETDNVATALRELAVGEEALVGVLDRTVPVRVRQAIPFGHKLSMTDLSQGTDIVKYGEVMGRATQQIPVGSHVHVHNIDSLRGRGDLEAREAGHGI